MAKPEVRLTAIQAAFALAIVAVLGRAAQVQVLQGAAYAARAEAQRTETVVLPAPRGAILDRTGAPLALSQEMFHLGLAPNELRDTAGTVAALVGELGLSSRDVRRALRKTWAYFHGPFTSAQVLPLRHQPGIHLSSEFVRFHPDPDFARPVLGRPAADGRPAGGIERVYDSLLAGRPGRAVVLRDGRGRRYESPSRLGAFPEPGHDLFLTLDAGVQEIAEDALVEAIERFDAVGGDVVVLDPHTGEVLAVASRRADGSIPASAFAAVFEPGSTAKIFAAAALLEAGLVDARDSVWWEGGRWELPYRTLEDDHEHPFHWMTLDQAIQVSSNIGTVKFALRLRPEQHYLMLRDFGFGTPTGVEHPAESRGILSRPHRWSGTTQASLAIGYELAVTPLQLAAAYAAIANDGVLLRPSLVRRIRAPDGAIIYEHRPEPVRRVVSPAVAARLRAMLRGVVYRGGTGASAALAAYEVAGKTGTARVAGPGGYVPGAHTAVFASLFPADAPQLAMVVKLDNPRGGYAAGSAAPLTRRVLERILAARTGALDRSRLGATALAPPLPAAAVDAGVAPHVVSWPDTGPPAPPSLRRVPDVRGLPLRAAVARLHRTGLNVRIEGGGRRVRRTQPMAGDSAPAGTVVTLDAGGGR